MDDHRAFIKGILNDPTDEVPRLVYADYLDERDDPRGRFLRLEVAEAKGELPEADEPELRRLREELDPDWLVMIERPPVANCPGDRMFEKPCDRKWDDLRTTETDGVRHCDSCEQKVYFSRTLKEARGHTWRNRCVAIAPGVKWRRGDLNRRIRMGRMLPPADPLEEKG